MTRKTTELEKEVFEYLNDLRESGVTNMFGSAAYVVNEFPSMGMNDARALCILWMKVFNKEGNYDEITIDETVKQ